jgi:AcrR family transcriptional regulator
MNPDPTETADAGEAAAPGLRERKKAATRRLISDTARELFIERGFEAVTVAEVAQAADVSEKTVFNYFPAKEDLFYSRLEEFEDELLRAIRDRPPGESAVAAFRRFLLHERGIFALSSKPPGDATETMRGMTRTITESPALLARERRVFEEYTESLAMMLAAETGASEDDVEPRAAAAAMLGVHRGLIGFVRRRTLAGDDAGKVGPAVRAQAERALARLESGLGDYAVKEK